LRGRRAPQSYFSTASKGVVVGLKARVKKPG
jgi:hypothetical protein